MKFKFFAFLILFICTPMVVFGDNYPDDYVLCKNRTKCEDNCTWVDGKCIVKCATKDLSGGGYQWNYYPDTDLLIQTAVSNACILAGQIEYICSDNGKWSLKATNNLVTASSGCVEKYDTYDEDFNSLLTYVSCSDDSVYIKGNKCESCPEGSYCTGGKVIGKCPKGYYCIDGKMQACKAGTYTSIEGEKDCKTCDDGLIGNSTSTDGTGSTGCVPCSKGQYADDVHIKCFPCPIGTYGFQETSGDITFAKCETCQKGRYTSETGQIACKECEPGSFCPGTESVDNTFKNILKKYGIIKYDSDLKPGGKYICPKGYYTSVSGQDTCDKCRILTTTEGNGSSDCSVVAIENLKFKTSNIGNISGEWLWPQKGLTVGTSIYNIRKAKK